MNFNRHSNLEGLHAFLGASKYHWINYTEEKMVDTYLKYQAAQKGTELHEIAAKLINMRINLPKTKKTLNMYVNDGIGFRMTTEQPLFYSENCFGTADTICFKNNFLRIHDYKSGVSPVSMHQLEIYEALFCLEYKYNPAEITSELRIYQNNEILIHNPEPDMILGIMEKIITFDRRIEKLNMGV